MRLTPKMSHGGNETLKNTGGDLPPLSPAGLFAFMKAPIPLPVKHIAVRHIAPGDWTADITFGVPNDGSHDDPTLTLNSGEGVELPPKVGDIMLVSPPEVVGYANNEDQPTATEK